MKNTLHNLLNAGLLFIASFASEAQLINGTFESGDLTGWTVFNDTNGTAGGAKVVLFDTAGTGTPSLSAQFEVGSTIGYVYGSLGHGGGISQFAHLKAGQLNISVDIAAYNPIPNLNADAGNFVLIVDGTNVLTNGFGSIGGYQTNRSTLNYGKTVAAGAHEIAIDMWRNYTMGTGNGASPFQYLDNIVLTGSAVPPLVPIPLNIQLGNSAAILSWTNAAFLLQTAASLSGVYTNIPGATSPYTNNISSPMEYFRLVAN